VCETTSKNSNVKKQHKTPSLEQQAIKLSKQEKHKKIKAPRQKSTTKQNDKKIIWAKHLLALLIFMECGDNTYTHTTTTHSHP
jgi:hypothetical protein